ncbi:uncharacterized protein [Littorina saxatilis]|uniref:SMB domain-containing protein n=1 Tax=Littorina saxatilis TaxID=31220 RepID=A0AAN9APR5_9CAEN
MDEALTSWRLLTPILLMLVCMGRTTTDTSAAKTSTTLDPEEFIENSLNSAHTADAEVTSEEAFLGAHASLRQRGSGISATSEVLSPAEKWLVKETSDIFSASHSSPKTLDLETAEREASLASGLSAAVLDSSTSTSVPFTTDEHSTAKISLSDVLKDLAVVTKTTSGSSRHHSVAKTEPLYSGKDSSISVTAPRLKKFDITSPRGAHYAVLIENFASAKFSDSCRNRCGKRGSDGACWCDGFCAAMRDCCRDFRPFCPYIATTQLPSQ